MAEQHDELLRDAYRGEVFGQAFFATLAEREQDAERVAKLRALERIEQRTAALLRDLAATVGVDVGEDAESHRQGVTLGEQATAGGWEPFIRGLHDALPSFLANFVRLRELAPDPHAPALHALVAHEQTINSFAELELGGFTDVSYAVLQRYLDEASPTSVSST